MIDNLTRAGVETQLVRMIEQIDRSRIDPYLCILAPRTEFASSFVPDGCPVFWLGLTSMKRPSAIRHAWRLTKYFWENKIDVLHLDLPGSTLFGIPVGWMARVPFIIRTRRDMGYWMNTIDRVTARFYSYLVDITITNCETCRRSIIEVERSAPERIVILNNDVDLSKFEDIATYSRVCRSGHTRMVGMVANLRPEKSPDVLLDAARLVVAKNPDVVFHIAGEGDLRPQLENQVRRLGLLDNVKLPGHVVDVPDFLSKLDVAVLSSNTESLPNVLVEYMAAGRPIVATRVGGTEELINNEVDGLIVEPNDPAILARAIDRLLNDRNLSNHLATSARQRVRREYGGPSLAKRFERMVSDLVYTGYSS